jgi:cell volume regulation protein A
MSAQDVIGTVALMLGVGLVANFLASAVRLPRMLVLLAAGALLGPHALDLLDIPIDSIGVQLLLSLGVAFILFYGGLGLSLRVLSRVGVGLILLAVPGVVVTALVVGAAATVIFGIPFEAGFLIGAVLAPTDPAILIPLFERVRLRAKVAQTVIAESALNDAVGAVLVLALAGVVLEGEASLAAPLGEFAVELALSTVLGVVFGVIVSLAVSSRRPGIWEESAEIAVLLVVSAAYVSIESAGGSGYMGAFVAGVIVGNMDVLRLGMHSKREQEMRFFTNVVAELAVMLIFIAVGANLPFDVIADNALPALAVIAVLLFVARPGVVLGSLLLDRRGRWEAPEIAFVAWTRETGVVPAALAGVLLALGVPYEDEILTTVGLVIVVTLLLQTTTKPWLARRLGLLEQ